MNAAPNAAVSQNADIEKDAEGRFGDLTQAEKTLLRAVRIGNAAVCSESRLEPTNSKNDNAGVSPARVSSKPCWTSRQATDLNVPHEYRERYLANVKAWERDRTIRAELIRWLMANPGAPNSIAPKGVWIMGAKILGKLDLDFIDLPRPLVLRWCSVEDGISLIDTSLERLDLEHSQTSFVQAQNIQVRGDTHFRFGFRSGHVNLMGAKIHGSLDFSGSRITNTGWMAVVAQGINVDGAIRFGQGFSSCGQVELSSAKIGGNLELGPGSFDQSAKCPTEAPKHSRFDGRSPNISIHA